MPYVETGALFWPDRVRLRQENPIWAICGLSFEPGASFETGQLVIDKARHWRALHLANWMNQDHRQFDDMLYGDKHMFYIAWRMIDQPFHLIRHPPRLIEHCFGQRDPERSLATRAMEHDFARLGVFHQHWEGMGDGKLVLLPDHRIGEGARDALRYWCLADGADGIELRLFGGGVLRCALHQGADGAWRGAAAEGTVTIRALGDGPASAGGVSDAVAPPRRDGTGWQSHTDNLAYRYEPVPRR